jgi:uncharacterized membrane protein YoaK (UPF0700 family)
VAPTDVLPATRRLSGVAVRDVLLVALTVSSGAVDAISFIALGKVFTAFMTGNVVFLSLSLTDAGGPDAGRVLIALAAFAAGVFAATRMVGPTAGAGLWPRAVSAALGCALTLEVVFLVVWVAASGRPATGAGNVLTLLMALAMGMQSGAVASLAVPGVFTTAATATVLFLIKDVATSSDSDSADRARLLGVLMALFAGAAAGGLLLVYARDYAPVLPVLATAFVIGIASRARTRLAVHDPLV